MAPLHSLPARKAAIAASAAIARPTTRPTTPGTTKKKMAASKAKLGPKASTQRVSKTPKPPKPAKAEAAAPSIRMLLGELRAECNNRGISNVGTKKILLERIKEHDQQPSGAPAVSIAEQIEPTANETPVQAVPAVEETPVQTVAQEIEASEGGRALPESAGEEMVANKRSIDPSELRIFEAWCGWNEAALRWNCENTFHIPSTGGKYETIGRIMDMFPLNIK